MNPVLLKPEADSRSQVIVMGKVARTLKAAEYYNYTPQLLGVIENCLDNLRSNYDIVVIEGAGSPAEINLNQHEIVNMRIARLAASPVVLVGDIDRGGVFAALLGTLLLLAPEDCERVKGLIINKFRGDLELLKPGLAMLEERAGKPVLGVVLISAVSASPRKTRFIWMTGPVLKAGLAWTWRLSDCPIFPIMMISTRWRKWAASCAMFLRKQKWVRQIS